MKLNALSFSVCTVAALYAAAVQADDITNHPASACVPDGTGQLAVTATAGVDNASTATVTAMCPVERIAHAGFATTFSGRVWVVDQHPTSNICCRVVSHNPGGTPQLGTATCSTGSATTSQSLVLAGLTDTTSYSHFFISCTVPPKSSTGKNSGLLTYRAIQN